MFNPDTAPASAYMPSLETAARSLKVAPIIAPVHSNVEIETTITALGREPGGGLVVVPDVFTPKVWVQHGVEPRRVAAGTVRSVDDILDQSQNAATLSHKRTGYDPAARVELIEPSCHWHELASVRHD
jgi:hypothetical protein